MHVLACQSSWTPAKYHAQLSKPKGTQKSFHPYPIKAMSIIVGLLLNNQYLAANERDMGIQLSLLRTIMHTHLKLQETFGALWANILTSAPKPGKTPCA